MGTRRVSLNINVDHVQVKPDSWMWKIKDSGHVCCAHDDFLALLYTANQLCLPFIYDYSYIPDGAKSRNLADVSLNPKVLQSQIF